MTGLNYDRYRLGLWKSPEGAIFHIEKCHIINQLPWDRETDDPHYEPLENYTHYRSMDFGMHPPSPNVCIWIAEHNDTGETIVVKEWRRCRVDTIDMAGQVKALDDLPIEATTSDNDENIQSIFQKHGIHIILAKKGPNSVQAGLDLIDGKLDKTRQGLPGGIKFYSNLEAGRDEHLEAEKRPTNIIQELKLITWDLESIQPKPVGERHAIDALRYHLLWKNEIVEIPVYLGTIKKNNVSGLV